MSMWTAIALIVIATSSAQALRSYFKTRDSNTGSEEIDQLNKRIDELESQLRGRSETLERIVTDNKDDLKRKFDHLDKVG